MSESFTCCCCGVTFNKCWSDQEAMAELRRISAEPPVAVVCDDCWRSKLPAEIIVKAEGQ